MALNNASFLLPICLFLSLGGFFASLAFGLDCYTDVAMKVKEDCQMHTGCVKKFEQKTQRTIQRACFLTPGLNDTCSVDSKGVGTCYCHTDLCNAARDPKTTSLVATILPLVLPLVGYRLTK